MSENLATMLKKQLGSAARQLGKKKQRRATTLRAESACELPSGIPAR